MTDEAPTAGDQYATCTAVLLSVPKEVAERIQSFLRANHVPCRIRLNPDMTPERLLEETLGSSGPSGSGLLDTPVLGTLLRGRLAKDLKAEIEVVGADIPPVWDILVRPEDLPQDLGGIPTTIPDAGTVVPGPSVEGAGAVETTVLCELPWDEAWRLTERLIASGIPAAVMAAEEPDRDRPMSARAVPVGVRPQDLQRARAFLD
jgi:hypothetical protein